MQDAAYETLLRGRRATLHERVAKALLQLDPEATETQAGLLAHHCAEAGLIDQAIDYWLKAGQFGPRPLSRDRGYNAISKRPAVS